MKEKSRKDIIFHGRYGESQYEFEGEFYRTHSGAMKAVIDYNNRVAIKIDDKDRESTIAITPTDRTKIASDGASTEYYRLPPHATELRHLISAQGMSGSRKDIFKACYRLGNKEGVDVEYDLSKMKFFIEDLIEMNKRGERL